MTTIAETLGMTEENKDEPILFLWYEDFRRMGDIKGLFVSTRATLAALEGKSWYLGEVLGKHSDVRGTFNSKSFSIVDTTQPLRFGFSPFTARSNAAEHEEEDEE